MISSTRPTPSMRVLVVVSIGDVTWPKPMIAIKPRGTFKTKIHRHELRSAMTPPRTGPRIGPAMIVAPPDGEHSAVIAFRIDIEEDGLRQRLNNAGCSALY